MTAGSCIFGPESVGWSFDSGARGWISLLAACGTFMLRRAMYHDYDDPL